ncbi:hypothetical protein HELRODRAFT_191249 [Helobdella robusta]|uniref:Cyclin-D-binding Myb-like transcription factor 1 n=1 Tax=Helobdella robusta TaxID=6412 RepID=T1FSS7_HELRO|nr:hypothetical protein HELRODRAFT_191249 [Helobdella robusta]ESO06937.1 hypothetical protein HELRODRAFT_191249 [Helobdella robusta]
MADENDCSVLEESFENKYNSSSSTGCSSNSITCSAMTYNCERPEEECPDDSADLITQAWFISKCDKMALITNGHKWKQGQWNPDEIQLLQNNINDYCSLHNVEDPSEIIFSANKDRKDFYKQIAHGLKRPLFAVYRRVIRMYDRKNYIGKYSPEELVQLKELQKKYGCDWTAIGNSIGRSASSVRDRCRLSRNKWKHGKWGYDEELKLCEIVYKLSQSAPGEDITSGLSWAEVAKYVGSRNDKQCRNKWLNNLNWKQRGGVQWTLQDDKMLLNRLLGLYLNEEADINWDQIAYKWPSVRSPQWLRCKWWAMKRKVSNYNHLTFKENLTAVLRLFEMYDEEDQPVMATSAAADDMPEEFFFDMASTTNSIDVELEQTITDDLSADNSFSNVNNNVNNELLTSHSYNQQSNHSDSMSLEMLSSDVEAVYYNQQLLFANLNGSVLFSNDDDFNVVGSSESDLTSEIVISNDINMEL